jgi:hypothetical protein
MNFSDLVGYEMGFYGMDNNAFKVGRTRRRGWTSPQHSHGQLRGRPGLDLEW